MRHKIAQLLTIALLSGAPVLAQGSEPIDPQTLKQKRIDFLTTVLSLTDAQKQQATTIFHEADQDSAPLRDSLKQQHQALDDAVKSNVTDSQIDQLATTLGSLMGQLTAVRTKAFAKFYSILTADQRRKLDQLQASGKGLRMMGSGLPLHRPSPLP